MSSEIYYSLTFLLRSIFSKGLDFCERWKMLMQGFLQCDKTAAVNSCRIRVVRFRGKYFVRLKPPGLRWSSLQCFIMLRTLFTLIALQLIKASLWIWGGSPMPRQSEALSYVPDTTCHRDFCFISLNRAQSLPLTFSNHVGSHLSRTCQCDCVHIGSTADQSSHLLSATFYLTAKLHDTFEVCPIGNPNRQVP